MLVQPFSVTSHNAHYEGEYSAREMEWRRICSIDKVNNLQAVIGKAKFHTVLEVGCGTGVVLSELRKRGVGSRHVGIDMVDPGIHIDSTAKGIEFLQYDGEKLPFPDGSFDFVYASHVIEHVPNPRAFISELARVAKDMIYLEVPCEQHTRTTRKSLQNTVNIGHINIYTPESFLLLMQTSGIAVENLRAFDHSLEVHGFHDRSYTKALIKRMVRGAILRFNPNLATRLFTYHCGASGHVIRD